MIEFNLFLLVFLILFIGQSAFSAWLDGVNIGYAQKCSKAVPPGFADFLDSEKLARMSAYTAQKGRLGIIEELVSNGVLLAILLSGLLPMIAGRLENLGLTSIRAGLIFFFVPGAIQFLAELPFGYYNTFVIEQKFGFNRSTLKLWIIDHIKSGAVGIVLFCALFSILMLLIGYSPLHWWFWGFLIVSAVQGLLVVIFPVVIAPLFNKFEPVKDEELAQKIVSLMEENGIRVKKVLQMNAGLRSRHTNAYFTGIGKTKQIVLFDTLLESHTHGEILSVLAHEIGHFRKRHVPKQLALFAVFSLAAFYVTWLFVDWPLPFHTFGFSAVLPYVGLFLAGILWQRAGFFFQPFYMSISRRFEGEADTFAVRMLGSASPLITAMKRLSADNLSNLNPHPLYAWFHYSHPPIIARLNRIEEAQRQLDESGSAPRKRAVGS